MNLGKLLAAGKSLALRRKESPYHFDKISLPKFVSPKNPFAKSEEQKPAAQKEIAAPVRNEAAMKTQKLPPVQKPPPVWTNKLNPISIFRAQQPLEKKSPPPVQAELSLEKVQVLRNDLTDADVEIVPIKSRPLPEIPELQPAKAPWELLGERLMRVTAL